MKLLFVLDWFYRYSGADLANLIKDASMEPMRRAIEATAFKVVSYNAKGKKVYQACSPTKHNAIKKTLKDFDKDEVQLAAVKMVTDDFLKFFKSCLLIRKILQLHFQEQNQR